jgi:hypothetical protein
LPIERRSWQCKHSGCTKHYLSKTYAIKHEEECRKNPERKGCYTCDHWIFCEGVGCGHDEGPFNKERDELGGNPFGMIYDCKHHVLKTEDNHDRR